MKTIKLLLTENVDNLGIVGDVVEVRPGYARNFLLPRAMATKPTEGAIKRLAVRRAEVEKEMALRRQQMEKILEQIKGHEVTLLRSANEQGVLFGSVSQHDIAQALRNEGYAIDDRAVRLGHQIKRLDSYIIPLVLAPDLKTDLKVWVVSDKPTEQLHAEEPAGNPTAGVAEQKEESKEAKPAKEGKPARAKKGDKAAKGEKAEEGDKAKAAKPAKE